ncbi:hypothetical protein D1610_14615 [Sphingomonas gilva]|uniref:Uncharacterized protein n=2 Tax=Sphingomonas gilva TaxID=2305907 RepID=A0A396RQR8_9SPHN|nr:hypothetical protein D1610_14615 [Sphingomonas gilva]
MQVMLWSWAGVALAVVAFAGFADWRNRRRRNPDRVAMLPWPLIQVLALLAALMLAAIALNVR